ncbi:hypothetical protein, partial [Edaphobacter aggregans]|uniref:hypothetical protein n=1 Tax=Edaphobacter aggregans TaxID=570835 RepID=UPI0005595FEA
MTALNRCLAPAALSLFVATALCQMVGHPNLPYTATKKETFVQKLADGSTITRVNTKTEARDSQGRTMQTSSPGIFGPQGVKITTTFVTDPVAHTHTVWMTPGKDANRTHMPDLAAMRARGQTTASMGSGSFLIGGISSSVIASGAPSPGFAAMTSGVAAPNTADPNLKPQMHTEKLPGKT